MGGHRKRLDDDDHGGEHGDDEGWIISYADMVTLLFGFFVILYSFATVDEKKFSEMGKAISQTFDKEAKKDEAKTNKIPGEITEVQKQMRAFQMLVAILNLGDPQKAADKVLKAWESESNLKGAENLLRERLKDNKDLAATLSADKRPDRSIVVNLPSGGIFKGHTDELSSQAKSELQALARSISGIDQALDITVEGHTDSSEPPRGSRFPDNWALSTARALAVSRELIAGGVDGRSIRGSGRAHFAPLVPEHDERGQLLPEHRQRNRRVEITLKYRARERQN